MNYESLKNVFGHVAAQAILAMHQQRDSMNWSTKRVLTLCEGYPSDTSTKQFTDADCLNDNGWDSHVVGKYEDALKYYRQALDLCPDFPLIWNNKGLAHFRHKQFDEARSAYERAIAINPLFIKPYSNLGILHYELKGDHEQARAWLLRALALDRNYQRARTYLTKIDGENSSADVLMIGTDPDLAAGLIEGFKKLGKNAKWIG